MRHKVKKALVGIDNPGFVLGDGDRGDGEDNLSSRIVGTCELAQGLKQQQSCTYWGWPKAGETRDMLRTKYRS